MGPLQTIAGWYSRKDGIRKARQTAGEQREQVVTESAGRARKPLMSVNAETVTDAEQNTETNAEAQGAQAGYSSELHHYCRSTHQTLVYENGNLHNLGWQYYCWWR